MNATETTLLVNELEEFVTYSFVVAAETSAGIGPYSDPAVTATTFQDGMCTPNPSDEQNDWECECKETFLSFLILFGNKSNNIPSRGFTNCS